MTWTPKSPSSFWILRPFLVALTWATMIAVATWPVLLHAQAWLGGRRSLAVASLTIALLLVLVVPLYLGIAAVVENATLPQQRVIEGTLATLADEAKAQRVAPPALLIVGEVVRLRAKLGWFGRAKAESGTDHVISIGT